MALPKTVTLTRDGGRYWRAMTFHWLLTVLVLPAVVTGLIFAIANPFWFRDRLFSWMELTINRFSAWRGYQVYKIYLGTDPKMWHTLKG